MSSNIPYRTKQPQGFTVHCSDWDVAVTGKTKGGRVCFLINNSWRTNVKMVSRSCLPGLFMTIKCWPFYLPREFSVVLLTAVYILLEAPAVAALDELHATICKQESQHPEVISIILGDFNHCILRKVLPKQHQHISCSLLHVSTSPSHVHTSASQTTRLCCFMFTSRNSSVRSQQ